MIKQVTRVAHTLLPVATACVTIYAIALQSAQADDHDIMAVVADGSPWSMQSANGRSGELTLNPDGTGQMQMGFMSMDATWTPYPGGFCLDGPRGTRCVTLEAAGTGFSATENGAQAFSLVR